jgi:hypothetical protein
MSLDAAEARRISAQLEALAQQRASGSLPHEDTPLRLYKVRAGGFVRVLDEHPEPISQGMVRSSRRLGLHFLLLIGRLLVLQWAQLEAIDAFIRTSADSEETMETKAPAEQKSEQETQKARSIGTRSATGGAEQNRPPPEDRVESADAIAGGDDASGAGGELEIAASSAVSEDDDDDAEKTQPSTSTGVKIAPPWEAAAAEKTPRELLARNERVSEWLGKQEVAKTEAVAQIVHGGEHSDVEVENAPSAPVDHPTLYEQWPPQLEERRKMWFVPRLSGRRGGSASSIGERHQPVVYWMHNTLRVTHGNFGLEAAILLSRRLCAPLVVVCLVPSSVMYPVCHSTTASDAYTRFSYLELYQQFAQAGVPFFGLTAKEDGVAASSHEQQTLGLKPNPLFELLDAFAPHAVVADAMFDSSSRSDLVRLARYLELNRSSCSWSLLAMDSTTCCPAYHLSMKLQSTLERGAAFASEEQFAAEYAPCAHPRDGTYVFSPLPRVVAQDPTVQRRRSEMLAPVLRRLHLEELNWQVVRAENAQSSSQMRQFSEGAGLQKLSQLLSGSDSQPAIQAELRGGGVLSLMPFIRHGTMFAGYVIRRISEAIASCPTPTTPQERKDLAMRKVSGEHRVCAADGLAN